MTLYWSLFHAFHGGAPGGETSRAMQRETSLGLKALPSEVRTESIRMPATLLTPKRKYEKSGGKEGGRELEQCLVRERSWL